MPYYGTKHKATKLIWDLCPPTVRSLIEPFCGSLSVSLTAPEKIKRILVNDYNALIVNFWRAVKADPTGVLAHARRPTSDLDMWAMEFTTKAWAAKQLPRMAADIDYHDVRMAGLWLHGQCNYLANNFGTVKGPWHVVPDEDGVPAMTKVPELKGDVGIWAQVPELKSDMGIRAKVPELNVDKGIRAKVPELESGTDEDPWASPMREIAKKLEGYRILCGDWARVLTKGVINEANRRKQGTLVFLDPPYDDTMSSGCGTSYACEDQLSISRDVRNWCAKETGREGGSNLVIMLCGRKGEHDSLLEITGWEKHVWSTNAGYGVSGDHNTEAIWCYNCLPQQPTPTHTHLEGSSNNKEKHT